MSAAFDPRTAAEEIPASALPERGRRTARSLAGLRWMAVAAVLFAVMNVLARLASARLPWPEVAAARTSVGAVVALAVAVLRRAPLRIHDRPRAWARSIFGTGAMLCLFYTLGAPTIALGDAVTLGSTSPVFIAILSPRLLGERSGRGMWVALVAATVGAALVAGPRFELSGHLALVALLGAFSSALAMIWLRKLGGGAGGGGSPSRPPESSEAIVVHFSLVASATMLALSLPTWTQPDATGLLLLAGTGLSGGLAQLAMTRAYALEHAARVGTVGYLGLVVTQLLGATLLGELPAPDQLAGSALVISAGLSLAFIAARDARGAGGSPAAATP